MKKSVKKLRKLRNSAEQKENPLLSEKNSKQISAQKIKTPIVQSQTRITTNSAWDGWPDFLTGKSNK